MQLDHLKRREFITLLGGALKFYGHTDGTFRGGPKRGVVLQKSGVGRIRMMASISARPR